MRNKNPFNFYIGYHIGMSLLIAFIIAFFMLHPFTMRERDLSFLEQIWFTLSYVIPQWYFLIAIGAAILGLFSFGIYGFLRGLRQEQEAGYTAVYIVALLISYSIFSSFFAGIFSLYGFFILIPSIVQCAILLLIEKFWLSRSGRKSKNNW